MKKISFLYFMIVASCSVFAGFGGASSYNFLNLVENARFSALGSTNVSLYDSTDINTFTFNPAMLSPASSGKLSFSNLPFYADIHKVGLTYVFTHQKTGTVGVNIQNLNYGDFTRTDEDGTVLGDFSPSEYAITISKAHTVQNYSLGVNFKLAGSQIAGYNSFAILGDLGGTFRHPTKDFTVGLVFKNFGVALKNYRSSERTKLPTDIQLGSSFKFEHLPLRLSLTAHSLARTDIQYLNPDFHTSFDQEGKKIANDKTLAAQISRHFTIGGEFLLAKNFNFRIGYNHQQRAEMLLLKTRSGAGFSWGMMLRVKSFEFNYARAVYHISGGVNVLTITMDLDRIIDRQKDKRSKKQQNILPVPDDQG